MSYFGKHAEYVLQTALDLRHCAFCTRRIRPVDGHEYGQALCARPFLDGNSNNMIRVV